MNISRHSRYVFLFTLLGMLRLSGPVSAETPVAAPSCGCQSSSEVVPASIVLAMDEGPTCKAPSCDSCDQGCDACPLACDTSPTCTGRCDSGCVHCCNLWTVRAEAMFLRRSDEGSVPLITDQNTGLSILDGGGLNYDHQVAPRLTLIRELCCCWGWELGYFGTDSWNTTGSGGGDVSPVLQTPGIPIGSTAPGTIYQVDASSELYSAEFNIRHKCHDCVTWLAGFRWIEFSDTLNGYASAPTLTDIYTMDATNHLYGFQIGADATLIQTDMGFRIDALARAGIMANHIDSSASSPIFGGSGTVSHLFTEEDTTGFVGELGVRGVLPVTNHLSVYGGYQVMWLDGVAIAADQIATSSFIAPGSSSVDTGTVLFHGATVGIEVSF